MISKVEGVKEIKEFRPISLMGSVYKVIFKILASRLRIVMPNLVGTTQSAFVSKR